MTNKYEQVKGYCTKCKTVHVEIACPTPHQKKGEHTQPKKGKVCSCCGADQTDNPSFYCHRCNWDKRNDFNHTPTEHTQPQWRDEFDKRFTKVMHYTNRDKNFPFDPYAPEHVELSKEIKAFISRTLATHTNSRLREIESNFSATDFVTDKQYQRFLTIIKKHITPEI